MHRPAGQLAADSNAENELYERGAELAEAAAAIRRGAGDRDAARALPALLGCVEAALGELSAMSAGLAAAGPADRLATAREDRRRRGAANLRDALSDAQAAAGAARALVARVTTDHG